MSIDPRQGAVVTLCLLVGAIVAVAAARVPWRRPPRTGTADILAELPAEQVARGKRLHARLQRAAGGRSVVNAGVLAGLGLTPAGAILVDLVGRPLGNGWVARVLFGAFAVVLITSVLTLPFTAWTHAIHRRHGLSAQSWQAWAGDLLKALVVASILLGIILLGVCGAGNYAGHWWWVWTAVFMVLFTATLSWAFPMLIAPIFLRFTPLEGPLRERLLALAAHAGVTVNGIFVCDASRRTRMVNASVIGLGGNCKVILYDTLLQRTQEPPRGSDHNDDRASVTETAGSTWADSRLKQATSDTLLRGGATDDQVAVIVAHELTHAKRHDLTTHVTLGALRHAAVVCALYLLDGWRGLLNMAGVVSITDPQAIALFLFAALFGATLLRPGANLISRRMEEYADWHALELTNAPDAMEGAWKHIAEVNLVDVAPNRLRQGLSATHPSLVDRIAIARAYANRTRQQVAALK